SDSCGLLLPRATGREDRSHGCFALRIGAWPMSWLARSSSFLRSLFRKDGLETEMDEALRFHLERQSEDNARAGMNREEARYAALRSFGGLDHVKEECRDARGLRMIDDLWRDLRYGRRMPRRRPGLTVVAL